MPETSPNPVVETAGGAADSAAQRHESWRRARRDAVTAPAGNLALVDFAPVSAEKQTLESPPVTVWREEGADHLMVTADPADGVLLDGRPLGEAQAWARLRSDGTPLLTWRSFCADAFSLDGSVFEVRIYDAEAPARAQFDHIDCFPYDPTFVVPAVFVADDDTHAVAWSYTRESDSGALKQVPGRVRFDLDGATHELVGFLDGPTLVITFSDATTGRESHAPGRFLKLDVPADGGFHLDLNEAFIPPCGFSDSYSCPLPPAENRLTVPVRAGERHVVWKGESEH